MKVAIKKVVAIEIECPFCREILVASGGQHFWDVSEVESGKVVECFSCKKNCTLPKC